LLIEKILYAAVPRPLNISLGSELINLASHHFDQINEF